MIGIIFEDSYLLFELNIKGIHLLFEFPGSINFSDSTKASFFNSFHNPYTSPKTAKRTPAKKSGNYEEI